MDVQRIALLKRKLEALNYDGELDPKSAPLAEKVRSAHDPPCAPAKKKRKKRISAIQEFSNFSAPAPCSVLYAHTHTKPAAQMPRHFFFLPHLDRARGVSSHPSKKSSHAARGTTYSRELGSHCTRPCSGHSCTHASLSIRPRELSRHLSLSQHQKSNKNKQTIKNNSWWMTW